MRPYRALESPGRQIYQSPGRQRLGVWPCGDDTGAVASFDFMVGTTEWEYTYSTNAVTSFYTGVSDIFGPVRGIYKQGNDDALADRHPGAFYPPISTGMTRLKRGVWNFKLEVTNAVRFEVVLNTYPPGTYLFDGGSSYYPPVYPFGLGHAYDSPLELFVPFGIVGTDDKTLMGYTLRRRCASFTVGLAGQGETDKTCEARLRGYRDGETPNF
jgi:hypothetical protein